MSLFKRDPYLSPDEQRVYAKAHARFSKLPKVEVIDWVDAAGLGMVKALDDYKRLDDPASVLEIRRGAVQWLAATDVLASRS